MKNLGGTVGKVRGRHDNPPLGYFPSDFTEIKIIKVEGEFFICSKCDKNFLCDIEMRGHIEANHTNEVKNFFFKTLQQYGEGSFRLQEMAREQSKT